MGLVGSKVSCNCAIHEEKAYDVASLGTRPYEGSGTMWLATSVLLFSCLFLPVVSHGNNSNIWVFLAASSNGWDNYRHQADVCHAYQIFHARGIPNDHIIVMMFDDIAYNENNPYPGKVFNELNGPDVYHGVPHDYTNLTVGYKNFLHILKGEKASMEGIGSGRVLESGPEDDVFVYLVDHGGPGFVGFIDGYLTANELVSAVNYMHSNHRYGQMVIFVEACNSGSLFQNLPDNAKVYVTTSASPHQPSFATDWDKKLGTYLGDYYSSDWMETLEKVESPTESLEQQYQTVKKESNRSNVMQYGDMSVSIDHLQMFFGYDKNPSRPPPVISYGPSAVVPAWDVPIAVLANRIFDSTDGWEKRVLEQALLKELQVRENVRRTVETIVLLTAGNSLAESVLMNSTVPTDFVCLKQVVSAFSDQCFNLMKVTYAMSMVGPLVNLCEAKLGERTIHTISKVCRNV